MKYKINDCVRVKSLEWYNENKNEFGEVEVPNNLFTSDMSKFCGSILTIKDIDIDLGAYNVEENIYYWSDKMFEGLVESNELNKVQDNEQTFNAVDDVDYVKPVVFENIVFPNENYADKVELCLGTDYEIVVEDGRTFVQKKKPKYPTTYEECCKIMGIDSGNFISIRSLYCEDGEEMITVYEDTLKDKIGVLWELLICRDAYWKIAGEEMGLNKPWKQDYDDRCFIIVNNNGNIHTYEYHGTNNVILAFPTEEMRDAFYDNFEKLINDCKKIL